MRDRSDGLSLAGRWYPFASAQKPAHGWLLVPPLQPATFIRPGVAGSTPAVQTGETVHQSNPSRRSSTVEYRHFIRGGLGITSPAGVVAPCLEGPVIRGVIFEEDGYGST